MRVFPTLLLSATFLCSLVAGFLFAFAVVGMPGIRKLEDREFIRSFQAMDGVIQNNQPIFLLVWVGSVVLLVASAMIGFLQLDLTGRWLLVLATAIYLIGVQLPTATINIPLNNQIQNVDVDGIDSHEQAEARRRFEPRWNRWNVFRTIAACVATLILLILLARL